MWVAKSGGTVREREVQMVEGLGWDATAKWLGLFPLWREGLMTKSTSHAMNDHTFLEELELNCPRERTVGSVAGDIRSEGCTRLESNRQILVRNIRRQI